jgi:hypothetical protein
MKFGDLTFVALSLVGYTSAQTANSTSYDFVSVDGIIAPAFYNF